MTLIPPLCQDLYPESRDLTRFEFVCRIKLSISVRRLSILPKGQVKHKMAACTVPSVISLPLYTHMSVDQENGNTMNPVFCGEKHCISIGQNRNSAHLLAGCQAPALWFGGQPPSE